MGRRIESFPGALHVGVQSVTQAAKSASTLTAIEAVLTSVVFIVNMTEYAEDKACSENSPSVPAEKSQVVLFYLPFLEKTPLRGVGFVCFSSFWGFFIAQIGFVG